MKKNIGNKDIDISSEEYQYYLQLVERFTDKEKEVSGKVYFEDAFDTDENGFITLIKMEKSIPWAVLFFTQQVMINQRMRQNDLMATQVKQLIKELGDKIGELGE